MRDGLRGGPLRLRILGARSAALAPRAVVRDPMVLAAMGILLLFQVLYIAFANAPDNIGDQIEYQQIGHEFGTWWFSGDARRTPGYPFLLGVTYELGLGNLAVKLWQAVAVVVMSVAVSVLIGMAAGVRPARIAAWAQASYLPLLSYSSLVLSDVAGIAATTVGVLCLVLAVYREEINYWYAALAAVLFLAGTMIRPVNAALVAVALLVLLLRAERWRSRMALVGIFVVGFLVMFGPWIGRNYARSGHPLVLGSTGQVQLAWGLHLPWDDRTGKFSHHYRSYDFFAGRRADGFTQVKAATVDVWATLGRDLVERPGEFLWSRVVSQYQLWAWPTTARTQYALEDPVPFPLIMAQHVVFLILGTIGLLRLRAHLVGRVMALLILMTAAEYLLYFPGPRYKFAVMPFLVGASGIALLSTLAACPRLVPRPADG